MKKYSIVATILLVLSLAIVTHLLLILRQQRVAICSLSGNLATQCQRHRCLVDSLSQSNLSAATTNVAGLICADVYLATVAVACELPKADKEALFNEALLCNKELFVPLLSNYPEVIRVSFITNGIDWTSHETMERSIKQKMKRK